jgi:hypothetical protein
MAVRKPETFPPVTMGHIRGHGCRDLLVYCDSGRCHHSATMNADWLPDGMPVRSLCRRIVWHAVRDDRRRRASGLEPAREQAARLGRVADFCFVQLVVGYCKLWKTKLGEQLYTDAGRSTSASSMPKHVWANGRGSCTIRTATATARQSVCWRLKKHPNLITANFLFLWPPHGSRLPMRTRP